MTKFQGIFISRKMTLPGDDDNYGPLDFDTSYEIKKAHGTYDIIISWPPIMLPLIKDTALCVYRRGGAVIPRALALDSQ